MENPDSNNPILQEEAKENAKNDLEEPIGEDYDKIISEKLKLLEEYENMEKDLQMKRQQLENDLNLSINKSKGLNTPDKRGGSQLLKSSTDNILETESNHKENPVKLSKTQASVEKENVQGNEFLSYYMKVSSETKIRDKDEGDYTFKPKINRSTTKKALDQISESKDQNRLDELYKLGLQKKQKQQELIKQVNEEVNQVINQEKVGSNSKKIVLKNMEKSLGQLFLEIQNPENKGFFNFHDLGNILSKLAIFRGSHYQRKDYLEKPNFDPAEIEKIGLDELLKESSFHEEFWKILVIPQVLSSEKDPKRIFEQNTINLVPSQLILDILLALLETNKEKTISANFIRERLLSSFKKQEIQGEISVMKEKHLDIIKNDLEGKLCLPIEKLIGKFRKLFVDKTKIMKIYTNKDEKPEKEVVEPAKNYDFKPKINEKSKNIDSQDSYVAKLVSSNSMKELNNKPDVSKNRFDLLYKYSKYESKKKEEETKARLKEDYKDCTFAPKINKKQNSGKKKLPPTTEEDSPEKKSDENKEVPDLDEKKTYERLYELYKKKLEKEELNTKMIQEREEEELIGCTFKPQTNTSKNLEKSLYSSNNVKGAEKVIERVAKAREERQEKINTFENMGKPKGDALQPTVFQPFSFEKRYDKEKDNTAREEPLLYLDINYGPGKIARIPVRKSDDPHVLCKTFSKIYSLNEKMQATLLETIQNIFQTQVWEEKK